MGLFTLSQIDTINQVAAKSKEVLEPPKSTKTKSINDELTSISQKVVDYFKDSPAKLITTVDELHDYISKAIESGYAGIDTETTGLDRIKDIIVGASLYYPGGVEVYIPMKHLVPIFDTPYKNQLTYEEVGREFQRLADSDIKLIFANADFDLAMIYKDLKVDLCGVCFYDVILAWRCLKENEPDNKLKILYNKYVLKGKGHAMKFQDFFPVDLFPYCKPEVAKFYAANDAKITYELFVWQLPYVTKTHPKCKNAHLERIADLYWNVEVPLIKVCQKMHRTGTYIDKTISRVLDVRYDSKYKAESKALAEMIDKVIADSAYLQPSSGKRPFVSGSDFNPKSPVHVKYLVYTLLQVPKGKNGESTDKDVLRELNIPVINQVLSVRSLSTLIGTFVQKMPRATTDDNRIHAQFKQIGADCVSGDTIIPTSDGYYLASELCSSAEDLPGHQVEISDVNIVNKDQELEYASHVITYKDYPTIKITTEMGFTIEGTPNHPIMVSKYTSSDRRVIYNDKLLKTVWDGRHFKNLEDIKIGDIVEIPCNYTCGGSYQSTGFELLPSRNRVNSEAKVPEIYDEEFAEFLGMYHADGSSYDRDGTYTISLSNDDPAVIQRFEELARRLFNVKISMYDKHRDDHEVESYINCRRIIALDKILSHGKRNKRIPSAIWKSPLSVINAYIRGMTLDSSVHYESATGRVEYEMSIINELDARLVQVHLASQGILAGWGFNDNKGFRSPRLKFNSDNYILFRDTIGFIEPRKIVETDGCVKNPYRRRRIQNSFRVAVKSIEYKTNDVYDLHVPETHSFVSNGIISHNTGRLSCAEPNLMNLPSHATDIRHMFRATPGYVILSSDYSRQEPALTAYISHDKNMLESFQTGRDIYASIASLAFNKPYEECLEFHPVTHEAQPEGKARRGEAKTILLGRRNVMPSYTV